MSTLRRVAERWTLYWAMNGALVVVGLAVGIATAIGRMPLPSGADPWPTSVGCRISAVSCWDRPSSAPRLSPQAHCHDRALQDSRVLSLVLTWR